MNEIKIPETQKGGKFGCVKCNLELEEIRDAIEDVKLTTYNKEE